MSDFYQGIGFLLAQSEISLFLIFWYTLIFEVPRYACTFAALALAEIFPQREPTYGRGSAIDGSQISVTIVGHNEADSIERCVRSLREQSIEGIEIIIVSDGSTDDMASRAAQLVHKGLADRALSTELRGGKSAGMNLGIANSTGRIIINVDCDCSFDRFAIERIVAPFADPEIGAVSGDIVVRNQRQSLVARFQAIEYVLSITVGKRMSDALGIVSCVSGAFSAFRRESLDQVKGWDVGGGEDLDLCMRLRAVGWRIAFVHDAICYTDVPATLWAFIRQRLRWERDSVRLRYRKHRPLMGPFSEKFQGLETLHQLEFLLFNVLAAVIFPIYIVWLFLQYGDFAIVILLAMQTALFGLDIVMLLLAAIVTKRDVFFSNVMYLPGFAVFNGYLMRFVRVWAYAEEWMLYASVNDNYVPRKVRVQKRW